MPSVPNGYQPDTKAPSARRADFDLLRRLTRLEEQRGIAGLPPGGDPGEVLTIDINGDPDWLAPSGGSGGADEVWIGPTAPTAPGIELWYDTDAVPGIGGVSYVHAQGVSAATWIVEHDLGWFPNVTVIDSGGSTVEGDIAHIDEGTLTLTFSAAFTGTAYLS